MSKRILIVESGMPVVPFEQSLLLRKEHELHRASNGTEALVKVAQIIPNLIILDEHCEDMSVDALIRQIRLVPNGRNASLMLLSSDGALPVEGVNQVLTKPIVGRDFEEACQRLLSISARKEARLLVYVNLQGFAQSNMFLCNSLNLSASGILILTARKMKLGDSVHLHITLPREREKIRVTAMVVREALEIESRLSAYGLAFQDLPPDAALRIRAYVEEERLRSASG